MTKTPYLTIQSPLDSSVKRDKKFSIQRLKGSEGLCKDFSYTLAISCPERLTPTEIEHLMGGSVTVKIAQSGDQQQKEYRYLNGVIYEVKELGMSRAPLMPNIWRYELEIGSWLTQLKFVKDCRIFQKAGNNNLKIVTELLRELGFTDFENKARGNFPNREYITMYNETFLDFFKRLTGEDGILWYFEHRENRHLLVFTNDATSLPKIPIRSWAKRDAVQSFCRDTMHNPVSGMTSTSYDPENPPAKNVQRSIKSKKGFLRQFHYPGGYVSRRDGEELVNRSMAVHKHHNTRYHGESTVRTLMAGYQFQLVAPLLKDLHQKDFLIRELEIDASDKHYQNRLVALPANKPYDISVAERPSKPTIFGPQTATVVGEAGTGKVHTDKKGRVKVRFHWDHHSPPNASHTSAFIRVAGPCSGGQRGFLFTPRIDEEVSVSFENGDPSKPLITGSLYSHALTPPKAPGAFPYRSIIKTGSETDANRITFDDTPGSEQLELQAKKDLNINVGGHLKVKVKDDITVRANKITVIIRKDIKVKAGGNIVNLTLNSLENTAGANINNMAVGGVVTVAGGLVNNLAGCTLTNTAILSVRNTSAGNLKGKADTLFANTALNAVANIGPQIQNQGDLAITNISKGGILNQAKDIKTETLFQKATIEESSTTETADFKIKGLMSKLN